MNRIGQAIPMDGLHPDRAAKRLIPAPLGVSDLLAQPEPEEGWLVDGLIPSDANLLLAGYPKTHKTNFVLEVAVTVASGKPLLDRYPVPRARAVGLVLMEDRPHRVRQRLRRICEGHGLVLEDLVGSLFLWFRPPLQLSNVRAMNDLAAYVAEHDLEYLHVDNFALVSDGNSNDAGEVTPQLAALARLRDVRASGLVVGLTHHARKADRNGDGGDRLTDLIRNSSAFGAWYDAGIVLSRSSETAPVTVRAELRDAPSPAPFAFTVEDEYPAGPEYGPVPGGWLRLRASDKAPEHLQMESAASRYRAPVIEHLNANPGCTKRDLRQIPGDNRLIVAAFEALCREGVARYDVPEKNGRSGRCWLCFGHSGG